MYNKMFSCYTPLVPIDLLLSLKGVADDNFEYRGSESGDGVPVEFIVVKDKPGQPITHGNIFCVVRINAIKNNLEMVR